MIEINFDFYLNNFRGMIAEILALTPVEIIKMTTYPHATARIEQFEKAYSDKDSHIAFATIVNNILIEADLDLKEVDNIEHRAFLEQIRIDLHKKFKLMSKKENHISTEALVIILEYCGILKYLTDNDYNQVNQTALLSVLLDRSQPNIKKAISGVNGLPKLGNVKNESSLNIVKQVAARIKSDLLTSKVEEDLTKLQEMKTKKG